MSLLSSVFGTKPSVPAWTPIDYNQVQSDAIAQNQAAAPAAGQLATTTNTLNQAELNRMLAGTIPDIGNIEKNVSNTLASETKGQLPPDVQAAVERSGIAKSLGSFGGGMAGEFVARDIGKTSYDIANQAMSSAERWIATARSSLMPGQMDVQSMFVTPQQRLAQTTEERNLKFEHDWLQNQIRAMPDPVAHGVWQAIDSYIHSYGGQNSYAQTQYPGMGSNTGWTGGPVPASQQANMMSEYGGPYTPPSAPSGDFGGELNI